MMLEPHIYHRLKGESESRGISVSGLIRMLILEYLDNPKVALLPKKGA